MSNAGESLSLGQQKKQWRLFLRQQLADFQESLRQGRRDLRQEQENLLKLLQDLLGKEKGNWAMYIAQDFEPDVQQLVKALPGISWWVPRSVPVSSGADGSADSSKEVCYRLEFTSFHDPRESGPWGIPQAAVDPSQKVLQIQDLQGILIPGLGFDKNGTRLGRGRGIFDQALAGWNGKKVGVCWDVQFVTELPKETHDQKMDDVVTNKEVFSIPSMEEMERG